MRRLTLAVTGLLFAGLLGAPATYAKPVEPDADIRALASSPQWLTTKVYIEGEPENDVKAQYPGVVGISMWDPQRNRYEFFYTDTGARNTPTAGAAISWSLATNRPTSWCPTLARTAPSSEGWKNWTAPSSRILAKSLATW